MLLTKKRLASAWRRLKRLLGPPAPALRNPNAGLTMQMPRNAPNTAPVNAPDAQASTLALALEPAHAHANTPLAPAPALPPEARLPEATPPDVAPDVVRPKVEPAGKARRAAFNRQVFTFEGERYGFNLYVPAAPAVPAGNNANAAMPMVVMLHGCQQDAPDFARGTAMNERAARVPCVALYPEQLAKANQMRCWNWFDIEHQGRHAGEPAMLAALTRQVAARYPVDPRRIYIAGLSAGGAMAAIVAAHNPDLFAAVGVHSGLPPGAAHDVMSAFSAMRNGSRKKAGKPNTDTVGDADADSDAEGLMPTIVFHGSADRTVHPDNGDQIVQAAIAAVDAAGVPLARQEIPQALPAATGEMRNTLRTVYRGPDGRSYVEYWSVEAGPHAWSGGSETGSFTDPHGPSASQAMLDFFLQHRRRHA